MSSKKIQLTLALVFVASLLVTLAYLNIARSVSANPVKAKLIRRQDDTGRTPNAKERAALHSQVPKKERKLKALDFKDMPLAVSKVRNLDSDTWHQDLQIEVQNISAKPIYSILAYLEFPEHKASGNRDTGITLRFGERKYFDIRIIGDPQDAHLNPGDSYVFTIPERYRKGLKIQHAKAADDFKQMELHFGLISFGDGTGFEAGDPTDYRSRTVQQSKADGGMPGVINFWSDSVRHDYAGILSTILLRASTKQAQFPILKLCPV